MRDVKRDIILYIYPIGLPRRDTADCQSFFELIEFVSTPSTSGSSPWIWKLCVFIVSRWSRRGYVYAYWSIGIRRFGRSISLTANLIGRQSASNHGSKTEFWRGGLDLVRTGECSDGTLVNYYTRADCTNIMDELGNTPAGGLRCIAE